MPVGQCSARPLLVVRGGDAAARACHNPPCPALLPPSRYARHISCTRVRASSQMPHIAPWPVQRLNLSVNALYNATTSAIFEQLLSCAGPGRGIRTSVLSFLAGGITRNRLRFASEGSLCTGFIKKSMKCTHSSGIDGRPHIRPAYAHALCVQLLCREAFCAEAVGGDSSNNRALQQQRLELQQQVSCWRQYARQRKKGVHGMWLVLNRLQVPAARYLPLLLPPAKV